MGLKTQVLELPASTRTAKEAAEALNCKIEQIIKSLVFRTVKTNQAILILVCGNNLVNESLLSEKIGERIEKANADFTREVTGFAIGGIPPFGHKTKIHTLIDQDLLNYTELWAAAGTPKSVFKIKPDDIIKTTGGTVVKVN
jgi:prolyl-tRNA editing enzyme YbaK/EbsC (Cys-tRNA(Pro) deacylase)